MNLKSVRTETEEEDHRFMEFLNQPELSKETRKWQKEVKAILFSDSQFDLTGTPHIHPSCYNSLIFPHKFKGNIFREN